jgi:outer membrane protein assembly factor BamD
MNGHRIRQGCWTAAALAALLLAGGCRGKKYENPITQDTQQPDKILFDKAIKDIEKGRYEVARLTLNTLMNTYDSSEFLPKAKLAIADSWMREGGSHGLAQAEAEYKDFILFYPTLEESAEAQMKICDIHYRQMEKPDRDATHALRAEEECRQVLTQFPNSRFAPLAAQKLREIQEVLSESEYRVGAFYHQKGSLSAASNRLQALTDHYPLYSGADQALWRLSDSYLRMGPRFRQKGIESLQRIVRDYPLSPLVEQAKRKLEEMEADIPEPDPVAYARMKYELENATKKGLLARMWGPFSKSPDVSRAAKSGQPAMERLRPTVPPNVPAVSGASSGVTDVTISTETPASSSALDNLPDARQGAQQGGEAAGAQQGGSSSGQPEPSAAAKPAAKNSKKNKASGKAKTNGKEKQ